MKHKDETVTILYVRGVPVEVKKDLDRLSAKYGYRVAQILEKAVKALKREIRETK